MDASTQPIQLPADCGGQWARYRTNEFDSEHAAVFFIRDEALCRAWARYEEYCRGNPARFHVNFRLHHLV